MTMIRYYVSGNTAEGFKNELATNLDGIKQKIFLKHPSYALKTLVFKHIISNYKASSNLEILCSSWSEEFLEGVIIRDLSIAIMDATLDTEEFSGVKRINMAETEGENNRAIEQLRTIKPKLIELKEEAYKQFETALTIHDDLEGIYIREMAFNRADELIEQFISAEVSVLSMKNTASHIYHRMFGTNTAEGAVNVASEIMAPIPKRYILKGRAGTGKSVFMKTVAEACERRGIDVELYHCSFDPSSIDMVLVRDVFCIMDGTSPHEMDPERSTDVVIDLYEQTITPGTDEKYAREIQNVKQKYKSHMKAGLKLLSDAGGKLLKSEAQYIQTISEKTRHEITTQVLAYMK